MRRGHHLDAADLGLLLPAVVHVLLRFVLRQSTDGSRSWAIVPPWSNTGLTYPDRLTSAYVRALALRDG
jgi:hypothetical protein